MAPGSVHPSGELVGSYYDSKPATIDAAALTLRAGLVAFIAVCLRLWPGEGARHEAALRFAGIMKHAGQPMELAMRVVTAACNRNGEDGNARKDRERAVTDTYNEAVPSGWKKLIEAFGFPDDCVPVFREWLGMKESIDWEYFNSKYAVIRDGSKVTVGLESFDVIFQRWSWDLIGTTGMTLLERGSKDVAIWLSSPLRREHQNGFCFMPKGEAPVGYLNLWRGWGADHETPGAWPLIRRHIYEVLAAGDEAYGDYILRWVAWMFQKSRQASRGGACATRHEGMRQRHARQAHYEMRRHPARHADRIVGAAHRPLQRAYARLHLPLCR